MFIVLKVMCFHGVGWVVMVSIHVILVTLSRFKCRMHSLLLAAYDIRIGGDWWCL